MNDAAVPLKRLKWKVLCSVHFTTIKKKLNKNKKTQAMTSVSTVQPPDCTKPAPNLCFSPSSRPRAGGWVTHWTTGSQKPGALKTSWVKPQGQWPFGADRIAHWAARPKRSLSSMDADPESNMKADLRGGRAHWAPQITPTEKMGHAHALHTHLHTLGCLGQTQTCDPWFQGSAHT